MTFDDAVEAARAKRAADATRTAERSVQEAREHDAGRRELAKLVAEAWRVLSENGQPLALEVSWTVSRRGLLMHQVGRYTAGRSLRLLGSSGLAITGQLELVRAGLLSDERLREAKFSPPPGVRVAWVKEPVSQVLVYPSSYQDEFYVREGALVYGATENHFPRPADEVFAQWVAESLSGS